MANTNEIIQNDPNWGWINNIEDPDLKRMATTRLEKGDFESLNNLKDKLGGQKAVEIAEKTAEIIAVDPNNPVDIALTAVTLGANKVYKAGKAGAEIVIGSKYGGEVLKYGDEAWDAVKNKAGETWDYLKGGKKSDEVADAAKEVTKKSDEIKDLEKLKKQQNKRTELKKEQRIKEKKSPPKNKRVKDKEPKKSSSPFKKLAKTAGGLGILGGIGGGIYEFVKNLTSDSEDLNSEYDNENSQPQGTGLGGGIGLSSFKNQSPEVLSNISSLGEENLSSVGLDSSGGGGVSGSAKDILMKIYLLLQQTHRVTENISSNVSTISRYMLMRDVSSDLTTSNFNARIGESRGSLLPNSSGDRYSSSYSDESKSGNYTSQNKRNEKNKPGFFSKLASSATKTLAGIGLSGAGLFALGSDEAEASTGSILPPEKTTAEQAKNDLSNSSLIETIAKGEGTSGEKGYSTTLGNGEFDPSWAKGKDITAMSMSEIYKFQSDMLKNPNNKLNSSAVGKFQILRKTLFGERGTAENPEKGSIADKLNLKSNDIFSKETQDKIGQELLNRRGYQKFLKGDLSEEQFLLNLSKEWASIQNPDTGKSYYKNQRAPTSAEDIKSALNSNKGGFSEPEEIFQTETYTLEPSNSTQTIDEPYSLEQQMGYLEKAMPPQEPKSEKAKQMLAEVQEMNKHLNDINDEPYSLEKNIQALPEPSKELTEKAKKFELQLEATRREQLGLEPYDPSTNDPNNWRTINLPFDGKNKVNPIIPTNTQAPAAIDSKNSNTNTPPLGNVRDDDPLILSMQYSNLRTV